MFCKYTLHIYTFVKFGDYYLKIHSLNCAGGSVNMHILSGHLSQIGNRSGESVHWTGSLEAIGHIGCVPSVPYNLAHEGRAAPCALSVTCGNLLIVWRRPGELAGALLTLLCVPDVPPAPPHVL